MRLIVGQPEIEPVTVEEAKAHLRVTSDDEDEYIKSLIVAAREWCETYQGRSWISKPVEYIVDFWPQSPIFLPRPPILGITGVVYADSEGEHELPLTLFQLDAMGRLLILQQQPSSDVLYTKISYDAGYGSDASVVPQKFKQAVLLLVGHWFENREVTSSNSVNEIPFTVEALLNQERIMLA